MEVKSLKYKASNNKKEENMDSIITLLDEHERLESQDLLTARILHAVNRQEELPVRQSKQMSFQMKLAGSFICSGILILITNIVGLSKEVYFDAHLMKSMNSIGSIISEVINQIAN